jgi:hypothetical protein
MATQQATAKKTSSLVTTFWLSILAGFLLLIANSAIWVNNYIFDENNFSQVATAALTEESSRIAIAETITNKAFEDRPVLKKVAGNVSVNLISGLLGSSQATNATTEVARRLNLVVTSNSPESVVIDLTGVKSIVSQLVDTSASLGREPRINPANIPDQVTVLDTEKIPNFYKLSVAFLWTAPLAFIGALAALAYPYIKATRQVKPMLLIQGAVVTAFGLLGLLVGPLFRPPLLANAKTSEGRVVIGNIYDAFMTTFNAQTRWLIGLGATMILVGTALYLFTIYRSWNATRKTATKSSKK